MNREKRLRYVLIAVGALILVLLALQFWVVKNKRYIFQGSVAAGSVGPPGPFVALIDDLQEGERLR
jgi:hypothetical protein